MTRSICQMTKARSILTLPLYLQQQQSRSTSKSYRHQRYPFGLAEARAQVTTIPGELDLLALLGTHDSCLNGHASSPPM